MDNDTELTPLEQSQAAADTAAAQTLPEQSLPKALAAGAAAALVGALLWALVTFVTEYQIGWMAVGVGFLVGYAVRFGKGTTQIFNITGAVLALLGCVMGNVFMIIAFAAKGADLSVFEVASRIEIGLLANLMMETFSPMDILFYGIAVYEGWRFSTLPPQLQPVA